MKIKYYLKNVDGLITPKRANETDAGYDITATSGPKIVGARVHPHSTGGEEQYHSIDYIEYETNLYFVPDKGMNIEHTRTLENGVPNFDPVAANFHTDLRPRSSISSKTNFVLANSIGLIDRGYHNQVLVRFKYIWQPSDFRIAGFESFLKVVGVPNFFQMYQKGDKIAQIIPTMTHDIDFQLIEFLPGEDRGGGFGSTDKKATP